MPDFSKKIVYLSQAQYQELITNESITVDGVTVTYNDNDIYVTPQAEPITDVKLAGTSIGSNGVANIPLGSSSTFGVIKSRTGDNGLTIDNDGYIRVYPAMDNDIKTGTHTYRQAAVGKQHMSVFYGLSKVAGADLKDATNITVGTYPDTSKAAIQNMLGITDLISTEESSTATVAHAINSTFMMNGKLHRATAAIAIGDAVEVGTNCEVVKADEVFVKNTDYASSENYGLIKIGKGLQLNSTTQKLEIKTAGSGVIKQGSSSESIVTPEHTYEATFYGLSKVAGVDLKNEEVILGTYPEASKTAIRSLIGAAAASDIPSVPVQDVQLNGITLLNNNIAVIPKASNSTYGTVIGNPNGGISIVSNILIINKADDNVVKEGTNTLRPIVPYNQHLATFYGLSKVAGVDMASSDNAVGTYTDTAKVAIRTMLGATSPDVIAVQDEQPTNVDTKVWLPETEATGIEVPTYAEFQALDASTVKDVQINGSTIVNNHIANIPMATSSVAGAVIIGDGLQKGTSKLLTNPATLAQIKAGIKPYEPIVPSTQYASVFYGLATAAGDSTQSASDNAIGTYTSDASAAIRSMLGAVGDVQVNGTSVVSNGVANIPKATDNSSSLGVVGTEAAFGIRINLSGKLYTDTPSSVEMKAGTQAYKPIVPATQHTSVFYGLAKAAGDTTMSSSSNAVGTYTAEAKAAIHTMLGIDPASIAAQVDIPLVETVSGTTPTITGQPNVRYVCGEVSTISITPPASGSVDVIFESGSTAAVLTVPNTVKWPAWFDATTLEADTTYEILITDGVYGSVMTWAT